MTEQDALEHSKIWHHAADEMQKLVQQAKDHRDWSTFRPMSAAACLARSVAEGYQLLAEGTIGS